MNENRFQLKENMLCPKEYSDLRKALGWEIYSNEDIIWGLNNSLYAIGVYDRTSIIGMGRVIGDGRICFYIQDIMVKPEYQMQGVGKQIMSHIMNYLYEHAAPNAYIGLMSKIGKSGFYEKYGFVTRPNLSMGPGMVIPNFKNEEKAILE